MKSRVSGNLTPAGSIFGPSEATSTEEDAELLIEDLDSLTGLNPGPHNWFEKSTAPLAPDLPASGLAAQLSTPKDDACGLWPLNTALITRNETGHANFIDPHLPTYMLSVMFSCKIFSEHTACFPFKKDTLCAPNIAQ